VEAGEVTQLKPIVLKAPAAWQHAVITGRRLASKARANVHILRQEKKHNKSYYMVQVYVFPRAQEVHRINM